MYNNINVSSEKRTTGIPLLSKQDITRFYSKVGFTANPDRCWNWQGSRRGRGYGQFSVNVNKKPINLTATRVAYFLHYQIDPNGLLVCHSCDNPACINPKHLFLGTTKQNSDDRDTKGRNINPKGTAHGQSKLTEENVRSIKKEYAEGQTQGRLGLKYQVYQSVISRIVNNKVWTHI